MIAQTTHQMRMYALNTRCKLLDLTTMLASMRISAASCVRPMRRRVSASQTFRMPAVTDLRRSRYMDPGGRLSDYHRVCSGIR